MPIKGGVNEKLDKNCKYTGLTVEHNEGGLREKGGLPGKFITGRIGSIHIKNLKMTEANIEVMV